MYEQYWQLAAKPFEPHAESAVGRADVSGGAAGPGWYFPSEPHEGASLKLRYAVDGRRSAAALAGPSGVGKSLLVRRVMAELDESVAPVAHLVFPQMSVRELLAYLADRLGAPSAESPRWTVDESLRRIEDHLEANRDAGRHALVIVDEAHLLEDLGTLETLRLLLNLGGERPAMTLLLVGQMGLLSAIGRTPALEDRIAVRTLLRTFTPAETAEYVAHRMEAGGATRRVFDPEAVERMHRIAGGSPRAINRLADLALVVGFAEQLPTIDAAHIESVSQELLAISPE
ncbi:MAG: AAA family ATPase [Planctomycetota bacterium]